MNNKIYINIPFHIKDEAKTLGAKYDPDAKSWYINDENEKELFDLVKVDVNYDSRDLAKSSGCIWDVDQKTWLTCQFNVERIYKKLKVTPF